MLTNRLGRVSFLGHAKRATAVAASLLLRCYAPFILTPAPTP